MGKKKQRIDTSGSDSERPANNPFAALRHLTNLPPGEEEPHPTASSSAAKPATRGRVDIRRETARRRNSGPTGRGLGVHRTR